MKGSVIVTVLLSLICERIKDRNTDATKSRLNTQNNQWHKQRNDSVDKCLFSTGSAVQFDKYVGMMKHGAKCRTVPR